MTTQPDDVTVVPVVRIKHIGLDWQAALFAALRSPSSPESETLFHVLIREHGFLPTLKRLQRIQAKVKQAPGKRIYTVVDGIAEVDARGRVDASIETEGGRRLVLQNGVCTDQSLDDFQAVCPSDTPLLSDETPAQLLSMLAGGGNAVTPRLICEIEFTQVGPEDVKILLPLLWKYIVDHRQSSNRSELVAVGSAIRKYIATMPIDRMGELSALLAPANQEPLPLQLELEVAKMIYRNFEAFPPEQPDPQPELALRLWEMVQAYINPWVLLRDKHSAVASLAIEAIIAMRSKYAVEAWRAANDCQYPWFGEMVSDDLVNLRQAWSKRDGNAVGWLDSVQREVVGNGESFSAKRP